MHHPESHPHVLPGTRVPVPGKPPAAAQEVGQTGTFDPAKLRKEAERRRPVALAGKPGPNLRLYAALALGALLLAAVAYLIANPTIPPHPPAPKPQIGVAATEAPPAPAAPSPAPAAKAEPAAKAKAEASPAPASASATTATPAPKATAAAKTAPPPARPSKAPAAAPTKPAKPAKTSAPRR